MNKIKHLLFGLAFVFSTVAMANDSNKLTKENIHTKTEAEIKARMEILEDRVDEIKSMDFSSMEKTEKKALKGELKEIKKEMGLDDRFTISVGAAIIIVLLLILIL